MQADDYFISAIDDGVDCDFKEKCTNRGFKCLNCKNNRRRDHYVPYPIRPWITGPYIEPKPTVTWVIKE